MKTEKNVKINENGGFYTNGTALSDEKYLELISKYNELGNCTAKALAIS